ncbi:hypothetical protein [Allokutzneria albata]|uniref:Uncharacterized protein n=1 Tax=Allokutzneria albata TaxID=211114 RepID=A0A1G9YUH1_ALLAB|nr:hypothetical protein [Allokutzneria albata]SDN12808.1 hypothetical protein SAMN04489726_5061 [Allokutzneria albata]
MAGNGSSDGEKRGRGAQRTQVLVSDLLHREGRAAQRPANQRTVMRAIGVAAGVVGVCGAIVAGTVILTGQDEGGQAQNTSRAQNYFTGGRALQPNLIGEAAAANPEGVGGEEGGQAPTEPTDPTATGKPAPHPGGGGGGTDPGGPTQGPQPQPGPTTGNPPPSRPTATPTTEPSRPAPTTQPSKPTQKPGNGGLLDPVLDLLNGFFRTAPDAPAEAYEMLAPQMRSGGVEEFRESWKGVRSATVTTAKAAGANTARVVVDYVWADGRRVRTEQRIVVTEGSVPRIADATVLSARNR